MYETYIAGALRADGLVFRGRGLGRLGVHPGFRTSACRAERRLSTGFLHTAQYRIERQRLPGRLDVVRCGSGRQPRLGLRRSAVLRLPGPPGTHPGIWCAVGDRYRGIHHRRLLGPLLPWPALVRAAELLDAPAAAASAPGTADSAESAAATRSTATTSAAESAAASPAAGSAVAGQTQSAGQWRASGQRWTSRQWRVPGQWWTSRQWYAPGQRWTSRQWRVPGQRWTSRQWRVPGQRWTSRQWCVPGQRWTSRQWRVPGQWWTSRQWCVPGQRRAPE
jgi:hypothetical protein